MRLPQPRILSLWTGRSEQTRARLWIPLRQEKDGTVKSKELYLGKYEVKEITAPYGMVLNEEVRSVELVYAGQNVDVTETATSFYNERQRVEIDLIKSLAIDEASRHWQERGNL